jgi:ATP-dependent protease ClpP protease subunit
MSEGNQPEPAGDLPEAATGPRKTPLYQSINAARYQRQAMIKAIGEQTKRHLICYVSGLGTMIDRDDTIGLVDLLHNVPPGEDVDLLLHTAGGDIDAAEKFVMMIRQKVGTAAFRVIVPDFAKSAGTLIALGADVIVMSDTSELGPIDPQIRRIDGDGNHMVHSVLSYLEAFEHHAEVLRNEPGNVASQIMMSKLDPGTLKQFEAIRTRAQRVAEDLLRQGMFRDHGNWSLAAAELMNVKSRPSHGQMISWQDALSPKLGLTVEHMDQGDPIWQDYWFLYCLQRLAITDRQKIFESDFASLTMEGVAA